MLLIQLHPVNTTEPVFVSVDHIIMIEPNGVNYSVYLPISVGSASATAPTTAAKQLTVKRDDIDFAIQNGIIPCCIMP